MISGGGKKEASRAALRGTTLYAVVNTQTSPNREEAI